MKELICICCPKGCHLEVDESNNYAVTGNSCPRGAAYGYTEVTAPSRIVTATVLIDSSLSRRCPVKTNAPVSKSKVFDVMNYISTIRLHPPVWRGQVIVSNIAGTDADLVVTKDFNT